MRDGRNDVDVQLLAHLGDVVVAHLPERFRVLLEGQTCRAPLLEQLGQSVGRLAPDHKEARVQLAQIPVQIFEALQQESGKVSGKNEKLGLMVVQI